MNNYTIKVVLFLIFISCSANSQTTVLIDQRLEDGYTSVSNVGVWDSLNKVFVHTDVPFSKTWDTGSQTVLGSQEVFLEQKYNIWKHNNVNENDVNNFRTIQIQSYSGNLTSQFKQTHTGIIIQNSLEGTDATGGLIRFRDPWFVDYEDGSYNNQKRNRGMSIYFLS